MKLEKQFLGLVAAGCLLFAGCAPEQEQPVSGSQTRDTVAKVPARIVSLAPSVTEILFELGLGHLVVGVTTFCLYPPEAADLPKIGGYYDINYEQVLTLQPDLVVLLEEHEEARQHLRRLGIPFMVVPNRSIEQIMDSVREIAGTCGIPQRGEEMVAALQEEIADVQLAVQGAARPTALISIGRGMGTETIRSVYIAGKGTLFDELLTVAGGRNVYDGRLQYPTIDAENILRLNPDVILELIPDPKEHGLTEEEIRKAWTVLGPDLSAVANRRIHILSGDFIVIPGPRFVRTLKMMAAALHPSLTPAEP